MNGGNLLVVEDSPTQGQLAVADLEAEGFQVVLATNADEALECLAEHHFDVVLSDIVMPGMDGYELCREIKRRHPDLPVVLLTSLRDPLDVVRGLQAGADNFLRKPYDREQLVSRIRSIRHNQELRRTGRATVGLELHFLDQRFMITAERQQILDLLVSTFEDLVAANEDLRQREGELAAAREGLQGQLEATEWERRRLHGVLSALPETLFIVDAGGVITETNESAGSLLGVEAGELVGRRLQDVVRLVDSQGEPLAAMSRPIARSLKGNKSAEAGSVFDLFLERPDGTRLPVIARAAPLRDQSGAVVGAVEILTEISGLLAHDPVTQLPTQTLFLDRLQRAIAASDEGSIAVLAVVLDRFHLVHEAVSAEAANRVLADAARRLVAALEQAGLEPGSFSPGFLGNDTFAVMLAGLADEVDAVRVAHRLLEELSIPVTAEGLDVELTPSVGVSLVVGPRGGVAAIAGAARTARRAGARGGRQVAVFQPSVDLRATDLLRREAELRTAIDGGQLRVHYQPLVKVGSETVLGVEALVRWQHPELGLLPPDEFIPVAESSGLIVDLGWWVLRTACRQVREWQQRVHGAGDLSVSVNLSALQLATPDAAEQVRSILDETGLAPSSLVLEITETSVTSDPANAAELLRALKALGVRLAIDDFGTGYSTLLQLRHFPVDEIKIDRAFVDGMIEEPGDAAIVASSIALGRNLGLDVVAEGVESLEELAHLRTMGCDVAQGYYWTRPVPAPEFEQWLAGHRSRPELGDDAAQGATTAEERARDEVLGYITHEFRNALAVIRGFADLLVDPAEHAPATVESARHIVKAASHLAGTLDLLSDVAVVERGQLYLKLQPLDVGALVQELVEELGHLLAGRAVTVSAAPGVMAEVDETALSQVLRNLVSNATKFSPEGSPVEIEVSESDELVRIAVRDHGPGVPEERRPELFRRFSRLGSREKGTGLGLYLSRLIARAHGGDLLFEPAAGGGACFVLLLPASSR